jgi:hypothetical protein
LEERIAKDVGTDASFTKSMQNLQLARDLIDSAQAGIEEGKLRERFAAARKGETEKATASPTPAEPRIAAKPTPRPTPTSQEMPASQKTQAAQQTSAPQITSTPKQTQAPEPESPPPTQTTNRDASESTTEVTAPEDSAPMGIAGRPGFRGSGGPPSEMGGRFGPRGMDRRFAGPPSESAQGSGPQGFGPRGPGFIPGGGMPGGRPSFDEMKARFEGPDGAKLIFSTPDNVNEYCQGLTKQLGIGNYLVYSSNGQTTVYLQFSGTMDELAGSIPDATVRAKDESKRELRIKPTGP